jgi:hypothetical protein
MNITIKGNANVRNINNAGFLISLCLLLPYLILVDNPLIVEILYPDVKQLRDPQYHQNIRLGRIGTPFGHCGGVDPELGCQPQIGEILFNKNTFESINLCHGINFCKST